MRSVARQFGVSLSTVQYWVKYAGDRRIDRIDLASKPTGATPPHNHTRPEMETLLVDTRRELRDTSALGEYGALAVYQELTLRGLTGVPSVSADGPSEPFFQPTLSIKFPAASLSPTPPAFPFWKQSGRHAVRTE